MAESTLLAAEHAEEELHELRRKFHPHHDYLNLIIPSTWYLLGMTGAEFYFYNASHLIAALKLLTGTSQYFTSASTSLQFFLALALFIAGFTAIYVVGQLINGFSALILDRTIVKKLLKYPFEIYQRRLQATVDDPRSFYRGIVLEASYLMFCINLVPLVFLELVTVLFDMRIPAFSRWIGAHYLVTAPTLACTLWLHYGKPSSKRAIRWTGTGDDSDVVTDYKNFARYHLLSIAVLFIIEYTVAVTLEHVSAILLLPTINWLIGYAERRLLHEDAKPTLRTRRVFAYAKACFTNPIYFAAKLTGYAAAPSATLIRSVKTEVGMDLDEGDLFWMTYLTVQNRGSGSSQTVYHFLAMYGMVRNLCNATAMALLSSVAVFWIEWPVNHGQGVAVWSVGLCGLMYILFIRYLYVYGAYFSKYVIRAAAFVLRRPTTLLRAREQQPAQASTASTISR